MRRIIPSLEMLRRMLSPGIAEELSLPGRVGGREMVEHKLQELRALLVDWRDGRESSEEMMDKANTLLDGYGVEYLRPADEGVFEHDGAYYVNNGETYQPTILLDLKRDRVWATSWGSFVEAEERAGTQY